MSIEVRGIRKRFGSLEVLRGIDLDVKSGELIALLGPSGSGKTTLLRIIAGLELADSGSIYLLGEKAQEMQLAERGVGFVFQHYALFKHMTVFENIAFGLRIRPRERRLSRGQIRSRVMELLSLLHLEGFHDRYPNQLSGGQRQRVALARALAVRPKVLLLDEPFGALDAKVRKELRRWLRRLHETRPVTTIFVTHDQEEALEVADRVVVINAGQIEQVGTPDDVYHHPVNGFVYDFMGNYNEFEGRRDANGGVHLVEYKRVDQDITPVTAQPQRRWWRRLIDWLWRKSPPTAAVAAPQFQILAAEGTPIHVFARPHEMYLSKHREKHAGSVTATLAHINPAGPLVKMELERVNGATLQIEMTREIFDELHLQKGDTVFVKPKKMRIFT